jgi:hypothetical protein
MLKIGKTEKWVRFMSDAPWNSVFAIAGVIVGFTLSQTADYIKFVRNKRAIKNALIIELLVIRNDLSFAVSNDHKLPRDRLPLVTESYDNSRAKLASVLKPNQLSVVQKTYLQIKQVSSPLKNGDTLLRGYVELSGDCVSYQHDLNDETKLIDQAIALLGN